ncbi:MAG: LytTR family transcriptional regulator [Lachnospiraceae bacterium]|nr:LytTR family transcriptional regulator [Lachnospiraceae bacterium]
MNFKPHNIVKIESKGKLNALEVNEIIYIESDRRYLKFHIQNEECKCIGKLKDYEDKLIPYGFLKCHRSILINMQFIRSIESNIIVTKTGNEIHMSSRRKADCLEKFNEYLQSYII